MVELDLRLAAQQYVQRLATKHGKGKALSILAHRLGRTVYTMWKNGQPFDRERFIATLNRLGRGRRRNVCE